MSFQNTPPVMYLDRNWKISENEKTDSVIARVQAHDNENDILTFDLVESHNGFGIEQDDSGKGLPFRINPNTGVVYLNESLEGRGGENFFLYVTVSDGQLTAKNEVYVNIQPANSTKYSDLYGPLPPTFTPHARNISSILPSFNTLPGVTAVQGQQPPNNGRPSSVSSNNIFSQPPPSPTYLNDATGGGTKANEPNDKTSTVLVAVDTAAGTNLNTSNSGGNQLHTYPNAKQPSPGDQSNDDIGTSLRTNLPFIFTVCGIIFLAIAVVVVYMFRRYLCAFGKSLKKKSKAEMAKKSNQSQISSSITMTEDSRNSMVLQNWNGPTAFSNRYVPWERDNQPPHIQVPTTYTHKAYSIHLHFPFNYAYLYATYTIYQKWVTCWFFFVVLNVFPLEICIYMGSRPDLCV